MTPEILVNIDDIRDILGQEKSGDSNIYWTWYTHKVDDFKIVTWFKDGYLYAIHVMKLHSIIGYVTQHRFDENHLVNGIKRLEMFEQKDKSK